MNLVVIDASTGEELPGIPTPLLCQSGGGMAYRGGSDAQPVWFAKQPGFESPDGYRRVRVVETREYEVTLSVEVHVPALIDTFTVEASDKVTAATKAIERASRLARDEYGFGSKVTTTLIAAKVAR